MRLIGMLDSPYVRRVAISLKLMELPFAHDALSVFRTYDAFAAINPAVKAPSLVTDEGTVLMESQVILEYVESLVPSEQRLTPNDARILARHQRIVGIALAAMEKSVQIVYEINLRPADKQHAPWLERVEGQLAAAYGMLEAELTGAEGWIFGATPTQADVTAAVAWRFTETLLSEMAPRLGGSALRAFSARAEATPAFASTPLF
ncbi:MAG: glutathione S-transferase [Hyphomicrobiales bacterium]|nr:MAG: glutathione S-transferase [Hyphomicrobiales bacterium]